MISLDRIELGMGLATWLFSIGAIGLILVVILVDACRV